MIITAKAKRRLERLEARLSPTVSRVLTIRVTRVDEPDRTIELVLNKPKQQFWRNHECDR
jgi:hypothetical protein